MTSATVQAILVEAASHLERHNEEYSHRTPADLIFDLRIKATLLAPTALQMAITDAGFGSEDMHKVERLLTKLRLM